MRRCAAARDRQELGEPLDDARGRWPGRRSCSGGGTPTADGGPRSGSQPVAGRTRGSAMKSAVVGAVEVGRAGRQQAALARSGRPTSRVCSLGVRDVEGLDAVEARARRSGRSRRRPPRRRSTSQNGCAQTATPPAAWIDLDRLGDGRHRAAAVRRARRGSGRPRAAARSSRVPSSRRRILLAGCSNAACARCGRPTGGAAAVAGASSSSPARAARRPCGARARGAVGAEAPRARRASAGVVVVDAVAEDVEVLALAVDRRELGRRARARRPCARAGRERLVDAVDRVMVGQREQLDARRGGRARPPRPARARRRSSVECDCRSKVGRSAPRVPRLAPRDC